MAISLNSANFNGTNGSHFKLILEYDVSQNTTDNYSDVTYYLRVASYDGYSAYGSTSNGYINSNWVGNFSSIGRNVSFEIGRKTERIIHNSDGTKSVNYNASIDTSWDIGDASVSGTLALPKINRYAVTNNVTGNDIEGNFSVNYTKFIDSYKYKLRISIPRVVELEKIDYNTTDETFTLSNETIQELYSRMTSNNISLGFAIETWDSSETTQLSFGNEVVITGILSNANPTFSNFTFADTNATTVALTGSTQNNVVNVNGYSNITATISVANKAVAQKGATMNKYRFSITGNESVDISYSESSNVSGTINGALSGTYNVFAVDSRNNSTLVTKLATSEINYQPISVDKQNSSLVRNNNQVGEYAVLTLSGSFWNNNFGVTNNSLTVSYRLKKTDSSTWITGTTTITPTATNNTFVFTGQIASDNNDTTWDLDDSYNVEVTVSDKLSSDTVAFVLTNSYPTLSLDKKGVGIMCAYDDSKGGFLHVGGKIIDGGTLIWSNSSPGSVFNAQNINLDDSLNNYDFYEILYIQSTITTRMLSTGKIVSGYGTILSTPLSNTYFRATEVSPTGSSFGFEDCHSPTATENNRCVPIYIVGYKSNKLN